MNTSEYHEDEQQLWFYSLTDEYRRGLGEVKKELTINYDNAGIRAKVTGAVHRENDGWHMRISADDATLLTLWKAVVRDSGE